MMRTLVALIAVLSVLPWTSATAEKMYKWIDEQGNVSYHDRPPPSDAGYRVEEKNVRTTRSGDSNDSAKPPVVLYSVSKCAPCDAARQHLQRRNVPFTEKNVEKDLKLQEELKSKAGALAVPVLTVGSKVLNSYAAGWLDSELDQAGFSGDTGTEKQTEKKPDDQGFKAPSQ